MQEIAAEKLDFAALIRPGDTVICGQGTAEPLTLTEALVAQRVRLGGPVRVFVGALYSRTFLPEAADGLKFCGYGGVGAARLARAGRLDVLPSSYSRLPELFTSGAVAADVVLLQLGAGEPLSLGNACDYTLAAARCARLVIAEINDRVPWTYGGEVPDDLRIDIAIRVSRPPVELAPAVAGETERRIAEHVAGLIPDGAVLQLGVGAVLDAILSALKNHRDLGIHSGLIGDGAADLMEAGVITNARKSFDAGVTVTGLLFGTRRLNAFAHRNRALRLAPPSVTHAADMLARIPNFHAVNSAIEVDLSGQVNAEIAGGVYVGAVGGQPEFVRGAWAARGGRSIIALPATAKGGTVSRIVPRLSGPVTSLKSDADLVVTEWGVAELRGQTLSERARRMIAIAAPEFREELTRAVHGKG